jgi:hypothetical protein
MKDYHSAPLDSSSFRSESGGTAAANPWASQGCFVTHIYNLSVFVILLLIANPQFDHVIVVVEVACMLAVKSRALKENYLIQKREKYFLAENKAKLDLRYYLPKEHNTHTYMHQVIIN